MENDFSASPQTLESLINPFDKDTRVARLACRLMDEGLDPGAAIAEAERVVALPVDWFASTATTLEEEDAAFGPLD